ncbi:DUF4177 domain-containing protein [Yoonia sp.]|uniref:DUF4177 domain-containing protein n=1 Tax=Yoonia sp. TaxID=2212373 RepID=UPI00358F3554
MSYEYKVVPAPVRGLKAKGMKTAEDRFANALQTAMNDLAADGWEYLRADTLPCEQREGLLSKTTVYQNMLVFRRAKAPAKAVKQPPQPPVAPPRPKTGEERVAEKKLVTPPKPPAPASTEAPREDKKPGSSPDVAAE